MKKIGTTSAGIVVVEMTDREFALCEKSLSASGAVKRMSHEERVTYVGQRLKKLKTTTKEAAVHSIEAMFRLKGGIALSEAERIIASLRQEKFLTIDERCRITFPAA